MQGSFMPWPVLVFSSASQFLQSEDASRSALEIGNTFGSASRRLARAVVSGAALLVISALLGLHIQVQGVSVGVNVRPPLA